MPEIVTKTEEKHQDNEQYKYTKSVCLNPTDKGGEAVKFKIHVFENEGGTEWIRGEMTTSCYGLHQTSLKFNLDPQGLIQLIQEYQETVDSYSKEEVLEKAQKEADQKQIDYVLYPEPNLPGSDTWDYMNRNKWHREGHGEHFEKNEIEYISPPEYLFSKKDIKELAAKPHNIRVAKRKADQFNTPYVVYPTSDGYSVKKKDNWNYDEIVNVEDVVIIHPDGSKVTMEVEENIV